MTTQIHYDWAKLADHVVRGHEITPIEALAILNSEDQELLSVMQAAYRIRREYYGNKVKLNMIVNAKSGLCPEDCGYCSQSIVSEAPIDKYAWLTKDKILEGARESIRRKAGTYCIVASGRRPSNREIDHVVAKSEGDYTDDSAEGVLLSGFLNEDHARKLADAGVHRYNHNLNTSKDNYEQITTTHTYDDRLDTVKQASSSGMSPCSGAIFGMGESLEERVEIAFALKSLGADSMPCNFLNAIEGTPLEGRKELTPMMCLKILAMMRFVNPAKEIRIAGDVK